MKTVTVTVAFGPQTCRLGSFAVTLPCAHSREKRKSTPYRNITRSIIAMKNYPARERRHPTCHACPHPHLRTEIRKNRLHSCKPRIRRMLRHFEGKGREKSLIPFPIINFLFGRRPVPKGRWPPLLGRAHPLFTLRKPWPQNVIMSFLVRRILSCAFVPTQS